MALDITKWSDFKTIIRQLDSSEAKEKYQTITIDSVGIAYTLCEQYICAQAGVSKLSEINWGQGYADTEKEFEANLRKIMSMGYGLIIIAHSDLRVEKEDDTHDKEVIRPSIPKRAQNIVNRLVDIIGYIGVSYDKDGNATRTLYTRETPTIMAGSRFKYLKPIIPFGYDELVSAIGDAIDEEAKRNGAVVVDSKPIEQIAPRSFEEIQTEARELWSRLVMKDTENVNKIMSIVKDIFGKELKLSEITEPQKELFEEVVAEMKKMN
jgi:hypothetical protein